ncbi:MAG: hypothetical protein ACFFAS_19810 [Promethearchaeota archaeon]
MKKKEINIAYRESINFYYYILITTVSFFIYDIGDFIGTKGKRQ